MLVRKVGLLGNGDRLIEVSMDVIKLRGLLSLIHLGRFYPLYLDIRCLKKEPSVRKIGGLSPWIYRRMSLLWVCLAEALIICTKRLCVSLRTPEIQVSPGNDACTFLLFVQLMIHCFSVYVLMLGLVTWLGICSMQSKGFESKAYGVRREIKLFRFLREDAALVVDLPLLDHRAHPYGWLPEPVLELGKYRDDVIVVVVVLWKLWVWLLTGTGFGLLLDFCCQVKSIQEQGYLCRLPSCLNLLAFQEWVLGESIAWFITREKLRLVNLQEPLLCLLDCDISHRKRVRVS